MRARASDRRPEAGFTMVEIMVAMLLLSFAIIGLQALYMSTTRTTDLSRRTTEATVLAQDKIETLRTTGPAATITLQDEPNIDEYGAAGGTFDRQYTETYAAGSAYADIAVTVSWFESGTKQSVTLNARRGP